MFTKQLKTGAGLLCLVAAAAICVTAGSPPAADDQPKPVAAAEKTQAASDNVTRSLTIHAPSVVVRAIPSQPNAAPSAGVQRAGQYAFVDAAGNLTSSPQPGVQVPAVPARGQDPTPYRSAVDQNAELADTRHIHAAVYGSVNEKGQIEMTCRTHNEPDHHCELDAATPAGAGDQASASDSIKEDR